MFETKLKFSKCQKKIFKKKLQIASNYLSNKKITKF